MARLHAVPIDTVDNNPFRALERYPYVERKLTALQHSIADVGLWEGVIGRKVDNRIQIAFGHHRMEAARRVGLPEVSIIVRDLSDEDMLKFMGRENMEDYNADFLTLLETWEAACNFGRLAAQNPQPLDVARFLGWARKGTSSEGDRMGDAAQACAAAHALILGGYISRDDLIGLTVMAAREIVQRAQARIEQLEKMAKTTGRDKKEVEKAKKQIGKAVKETGREAREGKIARQDLRGRVDLNAYRFAKDKIQASPLFAAFAKNLADSIRKMLQEDVAAEKLAEIEKALGDIELDEDKRIVVRIDFELGELKERAGRWQVRLTPKQRKVTHLKLAQKGDDTE